jgi:hypothetical protein
MKKTKPEAEAEQLVEESDKSSPSKTNSGSTQTVGAPGADASKIADNGGQQNTQPATTASASPVAESKPEKKHWLTWERTIEILKLAATIWAALLGSYVTMEYNQRQNELNRIQAIAQMLPHIGGAGASKSADAKTGQPTGDEMSRDGAFWAIFRTANDRVMLRDLASLFPLDIYRVVSSIALAGELDHDPDAIEALQVSSEKLAAQFSSDPKHAELASRLYDQALKLRERKPDDLSPLRVVDLASQVAGTEPTGDQMSDLVKSINDLADAHLKGRPAPHGGTKKESGATLLEAKQLYKRARLLGINNDDQQVQEQVARADLALASMYVDDKLSDDAMKYMKEAFILEGKITGQPVLSRELKTLDKDGDGFASLNELEAGVKLAQVRLKKILVDFPDRGAQIK